MTERDSILKKKKNSHADVFVFLWLSSIPLSISISISIYISPGNIYTTFYAYIYDFGYIGVIIWPLIMGFISQRIYKKARKSILNDDKRVKTSVIVYGYLFYMLAFSFFSNKFYEGFFTISFVKIFLLWTILSYLFNNLDTGGRKLKLRLKIRL